ncbi:MAG: N-acetylmuramoyl-L-alanine amidase [Actinomycetales bacterium]
MLLRLGDRSPAVAEVRSRLTQLGLLDDDPSSSTQAWSPALFDESLDRAVRTFQQERGLTVDGIVGPDTYRRLEEARWQLGDRILQFAPGHLISGDDVTQLQRRLSELGFDCGRLDGVFGHRTDRALREFQRSVGVRPDGTCGPDTFRAFDRLVRTVSGGNAATLREFVTLTHLRTGVADKVIVLDPDSGAGADICQAVANRIEGRLAALGTQVLLTGSVTPAELSLDESERADFANRTGAHLVISLRVDQAPSQEPNGVVTFYFGDPQGGLHSYAGRALAELIQEEICARTTMRDCRTHPRTWDLLRNTRMPAVRVELGYLSNPSDRHALTSSAYQDRVAAAIASAITRLCAPDE